MPPNTLPATLDHPCPREPPQCPARALAMTYVMAPHIMWCHARSHTCTTVQCSAETALCVWQPCKLLEFQYFSRVYCTSV